MTDLERMAREAGLPVERDSRHTGWWLAEFHSVDMVEAITKFADLIRADERERCAKLCEAQTEPNPHLYYEVRRTALNCADAIRCAA